MCAGALACPLMFLAPGFRRGDEMEACAFHLQSTSVPFIDRSVD
jgi:hypothetical protein